MKIIEKRCCSNPSFGYASFVASERHTIMETITIPTEEALRRLLRVVENLNTVTGHCVVCGCENHARDCAVKFATDTVDMLEPEPLIGSFLPDYDPETDGDYSSWLVWNNID